MLDVGNPTKKAVLGLSSWECSSVTETDLSHRYGGSTGRRVRAGMQEAQGTGRPEDLPGLMLMGHQEGLPGGGHVCSEMKDEWV